VPKLHDVNMPRPCRRRRSESRARTVRNKRGRNRERGCRTRGSDGTRARRSLRTDSASAVPGVIVDSVRNPLRATCGPLARSVPFAHPCPEGATNRLPDLRANADHGDTDLTRGE
jgi:hypothetical protein